jgi:hypothetical protein
VEVEECQRWAVEEPEGGAGRCRNGRAREGTSAAMVLGREYEERKVVWGWIKRDTHAHQDDEIARSVSLIGIFPIVKQNYMSGIDDSSLVCCSCMLFECKQCFFSYVE